MNIAHLILAHNNPQQLERLISRLYYADDAVFIHLDKKVPMNDFDYLKKYKNVFFVDQRVAISWGSFNMIAATINSFKAIMKSGNYDYINLLSGADYPLQTPQQMHRFLAAQPGKAFMSYLHMDTDWQEAQPRVSRYHFTNFSFPGRHSIEQWVNKLLPARLVPGNLVIVGRSQWFTIPAGCAQYILDYWQRHPRFVRFLKYTWGSDEFAFQTILYNSEHRQNMVNSNLRFMDWSAGGASPATLTLAHQEQLLASDKLFARKFDAEKDAAIIDLIDEKLNTEPAIS